MTSLSDVLLSGVILAAVQALAALPWLYALDSEEFRSRIRSGQSWLIAAGVVLVGGVALGWFMYYRNDPTQLEFFGRVYGSVLHAQLAVDFVLLMLGLLLVVWPRGGTVALATFREGYRQPMFWLLAG